MFDDDEDDGYTSAPTTTLSSYDHESPLEASARERTPEWHRGLDVGLLVLRVVVGALFVAHGADKLFGWFNDGMGMEATRQMLVGFGYTEPGALALVVALAETVGGVLVILGLFLLGFLAVIARMYKKAVQGEALLRTGMGGVEKSNTWQAFKWGYGPYLDGIFTQSNYGVVTKMGMWLMPAPPAYKPFSIRYESTDDIALIALRVPD